MLLGEPSNICTECGASPQDVRHLFACSKHPTDLSPEDLWRNPVRSICALNYLDNGPGRGKQQHQSKRRRPTNCQKGETILHTIILKAASHHIRSGQHRLNTEIVPAEISWKMRALDDPRSKDPISPALQQKNDEITRTTNGLRRQTWPVRGEAGAQVRPFQTVENYQGNTRQITAKCWEQSHHI